MLLFKLASFFNSLLYYWFGKRKRKMWNVKYINWFTLSRNRARNLNLNEISGILNLEYPTEIILPLIYNKGFCNWQKKLLGNHELNCFRSNFLKGSKSLALQSKKSWKKLGKCVFFSKYYVARCSSDPQTYFGSK